MSAPRPVSISWDGFLKRPALLCDRDHVLSAFEGKTVLITGAGGSIGSALTCALAEFSPRRLICLEASEFSLFRLQAALTSAVDHQLLLGNAGDGALIEEILRVHQPQIIYHAAAFKHVPLL